MNRRIINKYTIFSFENREELLRYIENKTVILIAMNAEKILTDDKKLRNIVNENIGYPDGIGTVMALKKKASGR